MYAYVPGSRRCGGAVHSGGALGAVRRQPLGAGSAGNLPSADRALSPPRVRVLRGLCGRSGCRLP